MAPEQLDLRLEAQEKAISQLTATVGELVEHFKEMCQKVDGLEKTMRRSEERQLERDRQYGDILAQAQILADGSHHARGAAERCALACESVERMMKRDTLPMRSEEETPPKGTRGMSSAPPLNGGGTVKQ